MKIFIETIIVIVLGIMSMFYLTLEIWKGKHPFNEKLQKLWRKRKKILIYCFLSILSGIGLTILFHYIYHYNTLIMNIRLLTLMMLLFPIAWVDYQKHIIPNKLILFGMILRIPYMLIEMTLYTESFVPMVKDIFYAIIFVLIMFIICAVVIKTGIGMGDIKLLAMIGLYQGFSGMFSSLFMSLTIAFIIAIVLLISRRKKKQDMMPFAPALLLGTLISIAITGV